MTGNACFSYRLTRGGGEGTHVILVRLRGVFVVLAVSVQGIFDNCRLQQSAFAINDGHSDAQSSKVNTRNDGHGQTSPSGESLASASKLRVLGSHSYSLRNRA